MFESIMGIAGFILTVASAIYAVWVYRKTKRNTALLFRKLECYTLFAPDVNRLNIELSYNNQSIKNNLILLRGCLVNTGQTDIDKNRIFRPLKIVADKNYKWLEARQTQVPEGAATSIEISSSSEILIQWDLLKSNEVFEFECLVEIEGTKDADYNTTVEFINSLRFDYRITDLRSISREKEEDLTADGNLTKIILKILPWFMFFVAFINIWPLFVPGSSLGVGNRHDIRFTITDSNKTSLVTIESDRKNDLQVTDENQDCKRMTVKEFNTRYKLSSVNDTKINGQSKYVSLFIGIMIILGGIGIIIMNRKT